MKKRLSVLTNGILRENPVLVLVLGTCPTLAMTSSVMSGVGMGLAATFVLMCSGAAVSALRRVIPDKVRIPAYITLIASFVTVVQLAVEAFLPSLYDVLGIYLPLIVVNCIILGRAEMFASKNTVVDSVLDGLGMGLGFTLTLFLMGSVRELLGAGTWFGLRVLPQEMTVGIFTAAPGGFFTFGCLIALLTAFKNRRGKGGAEVGGPPDEGCPAGCAGCKLCGGEDKK